MSTIGSTRTRITGLAGFDTETMVRQLMNAESMKLNQLKQKSQLLTWQQEAYRGVTTSLKTFQDTFLNFANMSTNFKSSTMFSSLKVSVTGSSGSDMKGVSVKSTSGAQNTTATLKIEEFASKDTYVGNSLNTSVTAGEVKDLKSLKAGDSFDITLDKKTTTIKLDADMFDKGNDGEILNLNIDKLNAKLENEFGKDGSIAKVRFEKNTDGALVLHTTSGHNVSISNSADSPGASVTSGTLNTESLDNLNFKVNGSNIQINLNVNNTADKIVAEINAQTGSSGLKAEVVDGKIKFTATGEDKDITITSEDGSMKKLGFNLEKDGEIKLSTRESTVEALGFKSGDSNSAPATSKLSDVFGGLYKFTDNQDVTLNINGKNITVKADDTIDSFVNKVNESKAGVTMKYSKVTNSFRIESNEMGSVNKINFSGTSDSDMKFITDALGFKEDDDLSHITKASDAIVWIDGKQTSRTSNTFEIAEGLEVTLDPGVQNTGDVMTIKAAPDTESTIDNIKKFIEEYNKLLDNLNNLYTQKREKSSTYEYYEPLTDDEKDAMSEKDIEKWEEKAKAGLLNNDPTIGKIITDLRSWVSEGVVIDDKGTKISLYDLGIDSNHWTDRGKLTIKDEDKLRKALEERPDAVAKLFNKESTIKYSDKSRRSERMSNQGLAYRIDDIIQNATKSTYDSDGHRGTLIEKAGMKDSLSATDNILYNALKEQDDRIYQMISRLNDKEDYYYKMFSAMETAMNKYNSQSSWLTQQFA